MKREIRPRWGLQILFCFLLLFLMGHGTPAAAGVYPYSAGDTVIGVSRWYKVKPDESLIEIARKFDLGYNEIIDANPGLDAFVPGAGAKVGIPSLWILPDTPAHSGVVINLAEMRLYYFFSRRGSSYVMTFPIGIGSEGHDTPVGEFSVVEKIVKPAWHVPDSIREENPELPAVVPPGPDNPLGAFAMRLSLGSVLIHGTNRPFAVGRKASHGCLRLYPEDIPKLFVAVPNRVKVTIVRQPVKVGEREGRVFIEVHRDEFANNGKRTGKGFFDGAVKLLAKKGLLSRVSTKKLYAALEKKQGIPTDITETLDIIEPLGIIKPLNIIEPAE
jgi:L,D-transpeptidase ErfK/SrfK